MKWCCYVAGSKGEREMFQFALGLFEIQSAHEHMTTEGWVFLAVAWAAILWVTFYTFAKILGKK